MGLHLKKNGKNRETRLRCQQEDSFKGRRLEQCCEWTLNFVPKIDPRLIQQPSKKSKINYHNKRGSILSHF